MGAASYNEYLSVVAKDESIHLKINEIEDQHNNRRTHKLLTWSYLQRDSWEYNAGKPSSDIFDNNIKLFSWPQGVCWN